MKKETKERVKRIAEDVLIGCVSAGVVIGGVILVNKKSIDFGNGSKAMIFTGDAEQHKVFMKIYDLKTNRKIIGLKTDVDKAKRTFDQFKEAIEKAEAC